MAARFDLISIAGIAVALIAILGGQVLEGGHLGSLLQLTAFLIVIGGTAGAIMLQHSLPVFVLGMKLARWIFQPPPADPETVIRQVVEWSNTARRGGLLALEPAIARQDDLFVA